ncbi:signal peptidase I [Shouchella hunanensis]|uniref:Signal peptidase I n=2 Tax=Shouchella TaxID=2893057 RepID=A0ABY7W1G8_9BACI|nr:signal peptidase I [Shouchella hunanensis]MED4129530.1 signal peptidase I [Shouchella miscanthi]WDF02795.1 signal peptidase I [Shouchella hunanensis]
MNRCCECRKRGTLLAENKVKSEAWGWIKAIVIALLIAFVVRTFIVTSFEVRGESMVPTAHDGERFIVNRLAYQFSEPDRFDLIVFHATEQDSYIKRVVGLPGDTIRFENDQLFINDEPIDEPFLDEVQGSLANPYTNDYEYEGIIPDNHVFVVGDNRPNSSDSRAFGPVHEDEIIGKVGLRFWPLSEFGFME